MFKQKIDGKSERQASLFDMIEEIDPHKFAEPNFQIETKPLSSRIKEAISEAMKNSGLKRYAIAGQMSELLAVEITESMLNSYTAESKECHRMPAEYIPTFCKLTKDYTVLEILVAAPAAAWPNLKKFTTWKWDACSRRKRASNKNGRKSSGSWTARGGWRGEPMPVHRHDPRRNTDPEVYGGRPHRRSGDAAAPP
ncbi:MAG: hypothetical protein AB9917_13125 [Negativicutes bacterium]